MADVIGVMNEGQLLQWDTALIFIMNRKQQWSPDFVGEGVFIQGKLLMTKEVKTEIGIIQSHCCS